MSCISLVYIYMYHEQVYLIISDLLIYFSEINGLFNDDVILWVDFSRGFPHEQLTDGPTITVRLGHHHTVERRGRGLGGWGGGEAGGSSLIPRFFLGELVKEARQKDGNE